MEDQDRILQFWLEPKPTTPEELAQRGKLWFGAGPDLDRDVRERFGELVDRARRGELDAWAGSARGRLALVILIDQFSRNLFRGSPEAFTADSKALELVRSGFESGMFDTLDALDRTFLNLPFSHAEDLECQKRAVSSAQRLALEGKAEWKGFLRSAVEFARKHLDVIARFGRFPHRNAVLGRQNTPEETAYLEYLRDVGAWL